MSSMPIARLRSLPAVARISFNNWLTIHENGPLWFRGYARLGDAEAQALEIQGGHVQAIDPDGTKTLK
jgi:hypothetical protein